MPRTLEEIEADIAKEAALWQAAGNRLDALRIERGDYFVPASTGEAKAAALKAEVDKAIADYAKPVVVKAPMEEPI